MTSTPSFGDPKFLRHSAGARALHGWRTIHGTPSTCIPPRVRYRSSSAGRVQRHSTNATRFAFDWFRRFSRSISRRNLAKTARSFTVWSALSAVAGDESANVMHRRSVCRVPSLLTPALIHGAPRKLVAYQIERINLLSESIQKIRVSQANCPPLGIQSGTRSLSACYTNVIFSFFCTPNRFLSSQKVSSSMFW